MPGQEKVKTFVRNNVLLNVTQFVIDLVNVDVLDAYLYQYGEDTDEYVGVSTYWVVSEYLAGRLADAGAPVVYAHGHHIWGRQITGQAIYLDGVIEKIFKENV